MCFLPQALLYKPPKEDTPRDKSPPTLKVFFAHCIQNHMPPNLTTSIKQQCTSKQIVPCSELTHSYVHTLSSTHKVTVLRQYCTVYCLMYCVHLLGPHKRWNNNQTNDDLWQDNNFFTNLMHLGTSGCFLASSIHM